MHFYFFIFAYPRIRYIYSILGEELKVVQYSRYLGVHLG